MQRENDIWFISIPLNLADLEASRIEFDQIHCPNPSQNRLLIETSLNAILSVFALRRSFLL